MIKKLSSLALLLLVLCLAATAQELGTWRSYLSYQIATKSEVNGSIIYSLMNGNLLSYDTEDGEVRTFDHMGALNDVNIAHIAYCKEAGKLLIVYSNSNIDLLLAGGGPVDVGLVRAELVDLGLGDDRLAVGPLQPQLELRLGHPGPHAPPGDVLELGRPDVLHLLRAVEGVEGAFENVVDFGLGHGGSFRCLRGRLSPERQR